MGGPAQGALEYLERSTMRLEERYGGSGLFRPNGREGVPSS